MEKKIAVKTVLNAVLVSKCYGKYDFTFVNREFINEEETDTWSDIVAIYPANQAGYRAAINRFGGIVKMVKDAFDSNCLSNYGWENFKTYHGH